MRSFDVPLRWNRLESYFDTDRISRRASSSIDFEYLRSVGTLSRRTFPGRPVRLLAANQTSNI